MNNLVQCEKCGRWRLESEGNQCRLMPVVRHDDKPPYREHNALISCGTQEYEEARKSCEP